MPVLERGVLIVCLVLVAALGACAAAGSRPRRGGEQVAGETGLLFRTVQVEGRPHRYAVYVPREYTPERPWPTIVFLNGRGECGTDGSRQAVVGLGSAVLLDSASWPFVIVFPQKPTQESAWIDHETLVLGVIERTRRELSLDPDRLYLTGLSQGGAGTWAIGAAHPELFAAIAPVCGYGDPASIGPALAETPIWAFHGLKDDVVPPEATERLVAAVRAAGGERGDLKATYFPQANHNSWDPAYRGAGLGAWFLEHRRVRRD